ncbi:hypothetical protein J2W37_001266 [Variovorax paradoxus]|uniref:hypothetical protein n=1 Tax=Variovorax paradoxus TaxID=34073 RepID=UPI00277FED0C|nr:hypothetical protein [Variovorax paradoxus]MDP9963555.1 hypothetical protein [Variovorax paradoxus]
MQTSDWISLGALAVSLASAGFTAFYARAQHQLNKIQLLEKQAAIEDAKKAKLTALLHGNRIISFRLEIINSGQSAARNVQLILEQGLVSKSSLGDVFPLARLLPGARVFVDLNEPEKWDGHTCELMWEDSAGSHVQPTPINRVKMR